MDWVFTWTNLYPTSNIEIMEADEYVILKKGATGEYREKGSKFLAYSYELQSINQVEEYIIHLKKQHPKARHWCYAYRLSPKTDQYRANDDGEPRGTAGLPIYNQILAKECYNVLVVVVRYFGGTKLGASGLTKAYKIAAELALSESKYEKTYDVILCDITYDYKHNGTLQDLLKSLDIKVQEHAYGLLPVMTVALREKIYIEQINKIKAGMLHRSLQDITPETSVEGLEFSIK